MAHSRDGDNIYFTARDLNTSETDLKIATFNVDRLRVVVSDPTEYYLTIESLSLNTSRLPFMKIDTNEFQIFVYNSLTGLTANGFFSWPDSYIYSIDEFVDMFNVALEIVSLAVGINGAEIPVLYFEPQTQLFYFLFRFNQIYSVGPSYPTTSPTTFIGFNDKIFQKIYSFPYYNPPQNLQLLAAGASYELSYSMITRLDAFAAFGSVSPIQAVRVNQKFESLFYLNEIDRFIITTYQIPIEKQLLTISSDDAENGDDNVRPVLLEISFDSKLLFRGDKYIVDIGDKKLIDLRTDTPIQTIQYKVDLQLDDGSIIPYSIMPGDSYSLTFGFRKKALYLDRRY